MLPMPALGAVFGAVKLTLIKHAPTILVGGGTVGVVVEEGADGRDLGRVRLLDGGRVRPVEALKGGGVRHRPRA